MRTGFENGGAVGCELFAAALMLGAAAGTALVASGAISGETQSALFAVVGRFGQARAQAGVIACASGAFLSAFALLLTLFVSGFCAWAAPAAFIVPFFRGMGFGCTCACLYRRSGAGVFGYTLCCLFPDLLFTGALLTVAAAQSARLSLRYFAALTGRGGRLPQREDILRYCGKFLILLTAAAVAAVLEAVIAGAYPAGAYM